MSRLIGLELDYSNILSFSILALSVGLSLSLSHSMPLGGEYRRSLSSGCDVLVNIAVLGLPERALLHFGVDRPPTMI